MKLLGLGSVLAAVVLATSGCGSSSPTGTSANRPPRSSHAPNLSHLPKPLRAFIHSTTSSSDGKVSEIDVYGPGSRMALVKASMGDIVNESTKEKRYRFYLLVYHGHFVCPDCTGPARSKPPHGTVETFVWSRQEGGTDSGFGHGLPAGVSKLHRLSTIAFS
jgi:hypothetical protein